VFPRIPGSLPPATNLEVPNRVGFSRWGQRPLRAMGLRLSDLTPLAPAHLRGFSGCRPTVGTECFGVFILLRGRFEFPSSLSHYDSLSPAAHNHKSGRSFSFLLVTDRDIALVLPSVSSFRHLRLSCWSSAVMQRWLSRQCLPQFDHAPTAIAISPRSST
jgi:hypothetical protein